MADGFASELRIFPSGIAPSARVANLENRAFYRYARQARSVDGASEVHKMVLMFEEGGEFWSWDQPKAGKPRSATSQR